MRLWLHRRFGIHHWTPFIDGGSMDKRRCRICGKIQWFDFIFLDWFDPIDNPACPQCGSDNTRLQWYEDVDIETGYRDVGCERICTDCDERF